MGPASIEFNRSMLARSAAACSFVVFISIGTLTTSNDSYNAIISIRQIAGLIMLFSTLYALAQGAALSRIVKPVNIAFILISWATLLSIINETSTIFSAGLAIDFAIILLGVTIFALQGQKPLPDWFAIFFIFYASLILFVTIITGGMTISPVPHFTYEYLSEQFGSEVDYGHGLSNIFGIAAIASAHLATSSKKHAPRILYFCQVILFLALSLLGGARGDSVIAIFLTLTLIISRGSLFALLSIAVAFVVFSLLVDISFLDDFTIISRFLELGDGELGMRDVLLENAFRLLASDPICLVAGCGPGYFQKSFGYEYGMYPHNAFIEATIIFGALISVTFYMTAARGLILHIKKYSLMEFGVWFYLFNALISMKSGSFFGSWVFLSMSTFFAASTIRPSLPRIKLSTNTER